MSNPWASSFDEYRQTIIGEGKGKKEPRWQDDDCDGKWYEKSDTDGKTSKREKKAKAKHYKEEKYDNTKSPDYKKKKKALAKKHGGAKNIKGHPQYEHHGIDIEHLDGTQTQIVDVVKAPKMVAAPKLSNWREDFVWDEALKNPKLELEGDGKKDVKNKVEINPTVATEGYMSKDKEGHTTGGFRISNKEAKKAKARLKKKYKKEEVEQIDEIDGTKAALTGVATIVGGGLELARRAKNAAERIRQKRTDAMKKALGEEEEKKKLTERDVYIKSWNRNPLTGLPDYKQDKKRKIKTANPVAVDKASYEPEGNMILEKPGDGWIGPTVGGVGIPNPVRITKDVVDKTNRNQQKKVDTINKISPGSASMGKVNYFNKGPSAASQKLLGLSHEPEGEVIEGYQRNPERDTRSARQRRMDDPDRGINSQAFRDFMAAQQSKPKKKKKKEVDESVYDTVKKVLDTGSNFMKKNPVGKALSNVVKPFKSTDGGSNRKSATAASQKAKGLRVAEEVVTELNRYEKETGKSSGSMNMPKGRPTKKGGTSSPVMRAVRTSIRKETGKPEGQRKTREKGEKTADMKGPSPKLSRGISKLKSKRELDAKARKAGYKNTQDYIEVQARYPDR